MKGYKRDRVRLHADFGYCGHPAVNVKCYHFGPQVAQLAAELGCSKEQAEKALEIAWDSQREDFWSDHAPELVKHYFGESAKFYSEGRSSGWLVVHSLPDIEYWDGVLLNRWALFERAVQAEVKYQSSPEAVTEAIIANDWHKVK